MPELEAYICQTNLPAGKQTSADIQQTSKQKEVPNNHNASISDAFISQ